MKEHFYVKNLFINILACVFVTAITSWNLHQSAETSMSATIELRTREGENVRLMRRLFNPLLVQPPCRSCILSFELLEGERYHSIARGAADENVRHFGNIRQ